MKFLFVVNTPDFFLSHRLNIALELKKQGHSVSLASVNNDKMEIVRTHGITTYPVPFYDKKSLNIFKELYTLFYLTYLYLKIRPDIVHHVTIRPILYGSFASRVAHLPLTVNAISGLGHVFINQSFKTKIVRFGVISAYRALLNRNNVRQIFQNEDDLNFFINNKMTVPKNSFLIKGAGVCMNAFNPKKATVSVKENLKVILPGRMLWEKGVGEFVTAAKILKNKNVIADFILVGGQDAKNPSSIPDQYLSECEKFGVKWIGHQSDMIKIFQHADIVCLPSYREGLPKALVEAAASGCPIVTTDVPGCREVVRDGLNGYLVPPKNATELSNAIEKLISDEDLRNKMGQNGRNFVQNEFSTDSVVKKTIEVYQTQIN